MIDDDDDDANLLLDSIKSLYFKSTRRILLILISLF